MQEQPPKWEGWQHQETCFWDKFTGLWSCSAWCKANPPEDVTNWYVCDEARGGCGRECEPITTDRLGNRIPRVSLCCKAPVRVATGRKEGG